METTPDKAQGLPRLDAQNPWPGLAAYDETSRAFFHGRETDALELLQLIRHAPLTVLYGKSGLGKSSLLQAGLFPKLRSEHYLPVYLHVDFSEQADCPPLEQVARLLETAIAASGAECPPRASDEDLWQYIHRKDFEIWSTDNFPLTPVLVFDQLEELFSRSGCRRNYIQSVLDNLADLIENNIPPELATANRVKRERLDMSSQRYRILLAFREDFLPDFLNWEKNVRSLLKNRVQLMPMSREQAIAATRQAGIAVLGEGVADHIVDFVANRDAEMFDSATVVEPVLLSLFCEQLNLKRLRTRADKIDATLVAGFGQDILNDFYRKAIKGMPENVPQFIETYLIQGDRYRGSYPLKDALERKFIQEEELNRLTGRFRLLRVNQQADTARIELIHDCLVGVVSKARDKRLMREREQEKEHRQKEEVREKLAQIDRERREQAEQDRARIAKKNNQLKVCIQAVIVFAVIALILLFIAKEQRDIAIKETSRADSLRRVAEAQKEKAVDQQVKTTVLRLVAEAQAMLYGARIESQERAFLQLLAAFHITSDAETEAGLMDALLKQRDLVKLMVTGDAIMAVAFSPDGGCIVSGSRDKTLRLWNSVTGSPICEPLQGHNNVVSCVAFNPDGSRIVSGSEDKTLRIWNALTCQPIGEPLIGHKDKVSCVAFSPDGRRIVSGSGDNTLRMWDADTRQSVGETLIGHENEVTCIAFSPDGSRIISGSKDCSLRLWDADTRQPISEPMTGHKETVSCLAFSPDGHRIVSGSWDNTLRLWDADTREPIAQLKGHWDDVRSVAFSPDGSRIVSGGGDKTLRLWDASSGIPIGRPRLSHKGGVNSVAFSPDGGHVLSGSWDNSLQLRKSSFCEPLQGHKDWVNSVAFNRDGRRIVSGSGDKTLRLWDADTGRPIGEPLRGHAGRVESVAFSPDGSRILSGSEDNTLRLWDANTREPIGEPLQGHAKTVTTVAFSPDGSRFVSGSGDNTLRLWDADTLKPIGEPLQGHDDAVKCVSFSPDGSCIVSGSGDKTLRLWNAKTGQPIGLPLIGHNGWVMSVAFSPDGSRIVSGSGDQTIRLWDAIIFHQIGQPLSGHEDAVMSVAFNLDGSRIVSGSWDTTLRLWDASTGLPIGQPLQGHDGKVQSIALSPDGSRIVSGSSDKTLHLWPVPTDLSEELCKKLTRNMSRTEWCEWVGPDIDYKRQCPDLPIPPDNPFLPASNKCQGKP